MSDQSINQAIGKRLCYLLDKHQKTQEDLAEYMGVSQATVSNWCKGIKLPRIDRLDNICKYFGVNRSELIPDTPALPPSPAIDEETHALVDFLYENPDYRFLFETARQVKKKDLGLVIQLLNRINDSTNDGNH